MANSRVAYGLAKKYGIDTTGMAPKEVWEALADKGVTEENYQKSENRQNADYSEVLTQDKEKVADDTVAALEQETSEYNDNLAKKYNVDVDSLPKPKKELTIKGGEVLWGMIRGGSGVTIEDIIEHPLIKDKSRKLNELMGDKGQNATINKNDSKRIKLRNKIANEIASQGSITKRKDENGKTITEYKGPVDKGFRAEIVIGPPAAGKSSVIVDKASQNTKSRVLDSDDIKKQLPEFNKGDGAGLVHQESSDDILEQRVLPQFGKGGAHAGENIIIPIVGKKPRAAMKYLDMLKEAGYKVHLSFNEVPSSESANRATTRFLEEGRFLDPAYIKSVGNKPAETYDYLKKNAAFDSFSRYNNDVPFGTPAIKVEKVDAKGNKLEWENWQ